MDENQGQVEVVEVAAAAAEQPTVEVAEETPVAVAEQPVAEAHEVEPAPTELKCRECGQTKPVAAFYKVTKDGKYRQPCKDCYDIRYYGRKHGERKMKVVTATTETPTSTDAAVAAVVETLPDETPAPVVEPVVEVAAETPAPEIAGLPETPKARKARKSKKVEPAAETSAQTEESTGTDEPAVELPQN